MSVSLLADDAVRDPEGLCSARFRADIVTHGLDYATLAEDDVVTIDGTAYRITRVGKRCHAECPLVQAGRVCELKTKCAFAAPVRERGANGTRERTRTHDR